MEGGAIEACHAGGGCDAFGSLEARQGTKESGRGNSHFGEQVCSLSRRLCAVGAWVIQPPIGLAWWSMHEEANVSAGQGWVIVKLCLRGLWAWEGSVWRVLKNVLAWLTNGRFDLRG